MAHHHHLRLADPSLAINFAHILEEDPDHGRLEELYLERHVRVSTAATKRQSNTTSHATTTRISADLTESIHISHAPTRYTSATSFQITSESEQTLSSVLDAERFTRTRPPPPPPSATHANLLRAHILSIVFANEISLSFPDSTSGMSFPSPPVLTTHPAPPKPSAPCKRYPNSPDALPPLSRAFYHRFIRRLPFFASRGEDYCAGIDEYLGDGEAGWLRLAAVWIRATRFDIVGFVRFYLFLLIFGSYDFENCAETRDDGVDDADEGDGDDDGDVFFDAHEEEEEEGTEEKPRDMARPMCDLGFADRLIHRLARTPTHAAGRFTLGESGKEETDHEHISQQSHRYKTFASSWLGFINKTRALLDSAKPVSGADGPTRYGYGPALFETVSRCPKLEELPQCYQDWCHAAVRAVAVSAENVLDDAGWRKKLAFIWDRLPVSVIVGSLRVVNPIPFVERLLKLFVWRPPGMSSLLMKLAAVICSQSKTVNEIKKLRAQSKEDSSKFARLLERNEAKTAFVDTFGTVQFTSILVHVSHVLPPILSEMWACINIVPLVATFFDVVKHWLTSLKLYDTTLTEHAYDIVVKQMQGAVWGLFVAGYPMVHALSTRASAGSGGIHACVDHIAREFSETFDGRRTGRRCVLDMPDPVEVVTMAYARKGLSPETLWDDVERLKAHVDEHGIDQRGWNWGRLEELGGASMSDALLDAFGGEEIGGSEERVDFDVRGGKNPAGTSGSAQTEKPRGWNFSSAGWFTN